MRRSFHALLSIAIFLLCCCAGLTAQTITANINGTVTDASGAVIPNAKITAVNVDTNVQTTTTRRQRHSELVRDSFTFQSEQQGSALMSELRLHTPIILSGELLLDRKSVV